MPKFRPSFSVLCAFLVAGLIALRVLVPGGPKGVAYTTAWVSAGGLLLLLPASVAFRRSVNTLPVVAAFWCGVSITWLAFVLYDFGLPGLVSRVFFMARFLGPYGVQPLGIIGLVVYGALNILGWALAALPFIWLLGRVFASRPPGSAGNVA